MAYKDQQQAYQDYAELFKQENVEYISEKSQPKSDEQRQKEQYLREFSRERDFIAIEKIKNGKWIKLPELRDDQKQLSEDFIDNVSIAKKNEDFNKSDKNNMLKRQKTGIRGEWQLREFLGLGAPDLRIGESYDFAQADVIWKSLKIGVKTATQKNSPLIPTDPRCPEAIIYENKDGLYLCGIASIEMLKHFQDSRLIINCNNPKKTGLSIEAYKLLEVNTQKLQALKEKIKESFSS